MKSYFESSDQRFQLYLGDCLKILKSFEANTFDLIFADPPYNLSNDGYTVKGGRRASVNKGTWDKSQGFNSDLEFHKKWIKACKRIIKPEGSFWITGTYHSVYQCGYLIQREKFKILNDIAWFKPNAAPNIGCRCFAAAHETLIWAKKESKSKHAFNYMDMKLGNFASDKIKNPGKQMRSVWWISTPSISEKKFGKHPTQKPLELLKRIVLATSKEDDLILDPFTGSSTTGIISAEHNRRFIGIDTQKEYLDLSIKRFLTI